MVLAEDAFARGIRGRVVSRAFPAQIVSRWNFVRGSLAEFNVRGYLTCVDGSSELAVLLLERVIHRARERCGLARPVQWWRVIRMCVARFQDVEGSAFAARACSEDGRP